MQLIQYETVSGQRRVGVVDADRVSTIADTATVRELALAAIAAGHGLAAEAEARGMADGLDSLSELLAAGRVLPPLDHEDPAHCLITGTGLTHTGSADTRNAMHEAGQAKSDEHKLTDSMKVFNWGLEGGRPAPGQAGRTTGMVLQGRRSYRRPARRRDSCPGFRQGSGRRAGDRRAVRDRR